MEEALREQQQVCQKTSSIPNRFKNKQNLSHKISTSKNNLEREVKSQQ